MLLWSLEVAGVAMCSESGVCLDAQQTQSLSQLWLVIIDDCESVLAFVVLN